ncbi:hypothetical protein FRUB_10598 [Fimbriiglobus ruber]|uniref:Uncharacterized protein n=1 Tax=Fimbriiglobus ruber TaxID=1908690 RepID=A0A225DEU1_9BACT|nr:hypothetical protein FRUB_10598 [Fimbriiglobus ruber]
MVSRAVDLSQQVLNRVLLFGGDCRANGCGIRDVTVASVRTDRQWKNGQFFLVPPIMCDLAPEHDPDEPHQPGPIRQSPPGTQEAEEVGHDRLKQVVRIVAPAQWTTEMAAGEPTQCLFVLG